MTRIRTVGVLKVSHHNSEEGQTTQNTAANMRISSSLSCYEVNNLVVVLFDMHLVHHRLCIFIYSVGPQAMGCGGPIPWSARSPQSRKAFRILFCGWRKTNPTTVGL